MSLDVRNPENWGYSRSRPSKLSSSILVSNNTLEISYDIVGVSKIPSLHCTVHRWSKDIMIKEIWPSFIYSLSYLKRKGHEYVYAAVQHDNKKTRKFQEMFGFKFYMDTPDGLVLRRTTSVRGI